MKKTNKKANKKTANKSVKKRTKKMAKSTVKKDKRWDKKNIVKTTVKHVDSIIARGETVKTINVKNLLQSGRYKAIKKKAAEAGEIKAIINNLMGNLIFKIVQDNGIFKQVEDAVIYCKASWNEIKKENKDNILNFLKNRNKNIEISERLTDEKDISKELKETKKAYWLYFDSVKNLTYNELEAERDKAIIKNREISEKMNQAEKDLKNGLLNINQASNMKVDMDEKIEAALQQMEEIVKYI